MKKCLVVDDSKLVRLVARKILADLDMEAVEAASGAEGLERFDSGPVDAVIVDWRMPNMNGLQFLRELRARPGGRNVQVIFCTTEDDDSHIREAYDAGADDCIVKPFDHEAIRNRFCEMGVIG